MLLALMALVTLSNRHYSLGLSNMSYNMAHCEGAIDRQQVALLQCGTAQFSKLSESVDWFVLLFPPNTARSDRTVLSEMLIAAHSPEQ